MLFRSIVIGRGGSAIDELKKELEKLTGKKLIIEIKEVKRFDVDKDAQLVAENIAQQLENRISFRRAMKSCMQRTMRNGALGIKTSCSGRLGGADMARTEFYSEGTIPLQTLRANIDYGFAEANTTYGKVGVKVWLSTFIREATFAACSLPTDNRFSVESTRRLSRSYSS